MTPHVEATPYCTGDGGAFGPAGKYIGIRIPAHLNDQLKAIAKRESNGKSAVCRRMLTLALATLCSGGDC